MQALEAAIGSAIVARGTGADKEAEYGSEKSKAEDKPVATVSVAPVRKGTINEQITAYGTVVAPPSEVRVVSVPFESRITKILVSPGQTVTQDQPMIEVEGSVAATFSLEEAKNTASAAERDMQLVKQRYEQKLGTTSELYTAENALRTAQARLQSLQQSGAAAPRQLKSESAGIVSKVDVQLGQIVAIGSPLVEVAPQNQIEVKLGIEPLDAAFLQVGQGVQLHRVDDAGTDAIEGKLRLIGQSVDPATRLVDGRVSLPSDTKLLLESAVTGKMTRASAEAIIVPRESVLPSDDGGYQVFTIKDAHAVKHSVRVGIENDRETQILGDELKGGDWVVVVGNYELEEGMAVEVQAGVAPAASTTESAQTQPVETQPAETQPAEKSHDLTPGPKGSESRSDDPHSLAPEYKGEGTRLKAQAYDTISHTRVGGGT